MDVSGHCGIQFNMSTRIKNILAVGLVIFLMGGSLVHAATFGHTNPETGVELITCATGGNLIAIKFTGYAGTGISMSTYGDSNGAAGKKIQMKLYDTNKNEVVNGITNVGDAPTTRDWTTMNFTVQPTLTNQDYYVAVWTDTACPITGDGFEVGWIANVDAVSTLQAGTTETYNSWPSTIGGTYTQQKDFSVYVTYTPAVAGDSTTTLKGDTTIKGDVIIR